jgi:hypothetical protein
MRVTLIDGRLSMQAGSVEAKQVRQAASLLKLISQAEQVNGSDEFRSGVEELSRLARDLDVGLLFDGKRET